MSSFGYPLSLLAESASGLRQVRKTDCAKGDTIIVKTANSVYAIRIMNERSCVVSGGWFDKKGLSPIHTRIVGCTWGGSAIKLDIIAACGLCLEFGNRLVTTPIQKIVILPFWIEN
jgi:hypothetical protein